MANDNWKTQTVFPLERCPQVTDEEFNLFHTIDRELYTRLILNLGRDPGESVQVMAFWIWLERESNNTKLIKKLLSLPSALLNELTDETRVCLICLESDTFEYKSEISLLPEILNSPTITIRFFHENRFAVLRSVSKIINTVCIRAFRDIPEKIRNVVEVGAPVMPMVFNHPAGLFQMGAFSSFDLAAQPRHMLNNDIGEMVGRNVNRSDENHVIPRNLPVDDRTIFLTFSKGYPTAEDEVKEYFTRRFGDFIQDLILQEVGEDEQVLYARMVVKASSVGVIEEIVGRGNKAKFTINGKHVWARKYVKMSRSPPRGGRSGGANSASQMATP